jgi:Bacterial regulatory proteins, luxR family
VLGAVLVWQLRLEEAESPLEQAERILRADAAPAAGVLLYRARGMLEMARGRDQEALTLSVNTVRTHLRRLYEKLDAHSRTEAVERARALGLLAPSSRRP